MNKILSFLLFLIGCSSANSQSCDLCGKWSFNRFEYAGYVTTNCESTAQQIFNSKDITIKDNYFAKTYIMDNSANIFDNVNIMYGEFNSDENAQVFFIKSGNQIIETFYMPTPDTIYLLSDGCRFYFKRN